MAVMSSPDALVIVLSAITSHLRVAQVCTCCAVPVCYNYCPPLVQFVASKLQALEMMKRISHHVRDDCILERILPYLVRPPLSLLDCMYMCSLLDLKYQTPGL